MVRAPLTPSRIAAVVIGASAGAIDALRRILPTLPAQLPWPVLLVVHLPSRRPSALVDIFSASCGAPVREPNDKEPVTPGIWFAPPDYHLLVEEDRCFALSVDEPVHCSRPSIDVLFESAARAYGKALLGVVLTGASEDGAAGARALRDAGGFLMVEDPDTACSPAMPRAAAERADPQIIAPVAEIASALCGMAERHQ
jgi:two-component system chemotaxis response regulator CheB